MSRKTCISALPLRFVSQNRISLQGKPKRFVRMPQTTIAQLRYHKNAEHQHIAPGKCFGRFAQKQKNRQVRASFERLYSFNHSHHVLNNEKKSSI